MKIFLTLIFALVMGLLNCCNDNKQSNQKHVETSIMQDTTFKYHFYILDSVVKKNPNDSIYRCCSASIRFMEVNTNIDAHSDGTSFRKFVFSKDDLRKWHEWYDKKYKKEE